MPQQRQPVKLAIAQLDKDAILRQIAHEIETTEITNPIIQNLIDDMIYTCRKEDGVGIAAPQVFHPFRLMIVASRPTANYPDAPQVAEFAAINPELLEVSTDNIRGEEGCMSIKGVRGVVERPRWIKVRYTDRFGASQERQLVGFVARVFLHEFDHLNGKVFTDKMMSSEPAPEPASGKA